jgi:hypothetical protein
LYSTEGAGISVEPVEMLDTLARPFDGAVSVVEKNFCIFKSTRRVGLVGLMKEQILASGIPGCVV